MANWQILLKRTLGHLQVGREAEPLQHLGLRRGFREARTRPARHLLALAVAAAGTGRVGLLEHVQHLHVAQKLLLALQQRHNLGEGVGTNPVDVLRQRIYTPLAQLVVHVQSASQHVHTRPHQPTLVFVDLLCAHALDFLHHVVPDVVGDAAVFAVIDEELLIGLVVALPPVVVGGERGEKAQALAREAVLAAVLLLACKLRISGVPGYLGVVHPRLKVYATSVLEYEEIIDAVGPDSR